MPTQLGRFALIKPSWKSGKDALRLALYYLLGFICMRDQRLTAVRCLHLSPLPQFIAFSATLHKSLQCLCYSRPSTCCRVTKAAPMSPLETHCKSQLLNTTRAQKPTKRPIGRANFAAERSVVTTSRPFSSWNASLTFSILLL